MPEFKKYPYRSIFPDSSENARNHQTLEDALQWARWMLHSTWRETNEYGVEGDYVHDAETALITNRNTGYRWILRRKEFTVEFQTPGMFEELVSAESIDVHLTIEEAEALAHAAKSAQVKDRRTRALMEQALDQIALLCRQVRERVRAGDTFIDGWTRGIPRDLHRETRVEEENADAEEAQLANPGPAAEKEDLSLKEAGKIIGKSRNTLYSWFRQGKFPPAVEVQSHWSRNGKPIVIVPRYRLEAWRAGERMPAIFQHVFEIHGLHEPPWACLTVKKGTTREDVEFWVNRRGLMPKPRRTGRVGLRRGTWRTSCGTPPSRRRAVTERRSFTSGASCRHSEPRRVRRVPGAAQFVSGGEHDLGNVAVLILKRAAENVPRRVSPLPSHRRRPASPAPAGPRTIPADLTLDDVAASPNVAAHHPDRMASTLVLLLLFTGACHDEIARLNRRHVEPEDARRLPASGADRNPASAAASLAFR